MTPGEMAQAFYETIKADLPWTPPRAPSRVTLDVATRRNATRWSPLDPAAIAPGPRDGGLFVVQLDSPEIPADQRPKKGPLRRVLAQVTDLAAHAEAGPGERRRLGDVGLEGDAGRGGRGRTARVRRDAFLPRHDRSRRPRAPARRRGPRRWERLEPRAEPPRRRQQGRRYRRHRHRLRGRLHPLGDGDDGWLGRKHPRGARHRHAGARHLSTRRHRPLRRPRARDEARPAGAARGRDRGHDRGHRRPGDGDREAGRERHPVRHLLRRRRPPEEGVAGLLLAARDVEGRHDAARVLRLVPGRGVPGAAVPGQRQGRCGRRAAGRPARRRGRRALRLRRRDGRRARHLERAPLAARLPASRQPGLRVRPERLVVGRRDAAPLHRADRGGRGRGRRAGELRLRRRPRRGAGRAPLVVHARGRGHRRQPPARRQPRARQRAPGRGLRRGARRERGVRRGGEAGRGRTDRSGSRRRRAAPG